MTGDFSTTSNWSPDSALAAGDTFIFTDASQQDVTTGLTAASALALCNFQRTAGYTGTIGNSAADALDFLTCDVWSIDGASTGKTFITGTTVSDFNISGSNAVDMGAFTASVALKRMTIQGASGGITSAGACLFKDAGATARGMIEMHGSGGFHLTLAASSTYDNIRMSSGKITCAGAQDAAGSGVKEIVNISGGRFVRTGSGVMTEVWIDGRGGSAVFEDKGSGTITQIRGNGAGGVYDGRGNDSSTVTITDASGHNGFRMLVKSQMNSYTITNGFLNFSSFIDADTGRGFTLATAP